MRRRWLFGLATFVLALLFVVPSAANYYTDWLWFRQLNFFNGVSFGDVDPLFHRDVSFYVFRLPIWQTIRLQLIVVAFLALAACALLYVLSGSFLIDSRHGTGSLPKFRLIPAARR